MNEPNSPVFDDFYRESECLCFRYYVKLEALHLKEDVTTAVNRANSVSWSLQIVSDSFTL
ncbi:hypothetical protein Avbf_18237 [Armadillidium vulgare]|nr:hypothetical protein Avbf_18237 [Armadillidium vulgare]